MYEVKHVLSINGVDIFQAWLDTVQDTRSKARITTRVDRASLGHFLALPSQWVMGSLR